MKGFASNTDFLLFPFLYDVFCESVSLSVGPLSHIFPRIKGKIVCKHNFKKIAIRINIKGHNFLYIMLSCQVLSILLLYFYLLSIQYKKTKQKGKNAWMERQGKKKSSKLISNRITHFSDAIEILLFSKMYWMIKKWILWLWRRFSEKNKLSFHNIMRCGLDVTL